MPSLNLVEAINLALREELARDPDVLLLGEDVGLEGGVFRVTEGLQQAFGAGRIIDTPLAESGIVGVALGLALLGLRPVAEIQFMGFLPPALDQIISHVGRYRHRSRGVYSAPLVIRLPYGGGIHAPEHHSESIEAMLVHTPGIKVVVPSSPADACGLLKSAIRDPDPVLFLEPKRIYRAVREEVAEGMEPIPLGRARQVRSGRDLTVIAWGAMVREAQKAAETLAAEGVETEIIDLRTLSPLDTGAILASVRRTGRCLVVHEAARTAGLGAEISALVMEGALLQLKSPVARITGFDTVMPLPRGEHFYLPDAGRIVRAAREIMSF
ncbi:pyruvate/2-oxoglutarate/acetoin dehydrogenase complex, dehydrogenase (E1) component [Desulfuromonas soudanensis]|uniref:Pyruvate/2-oxoglutarate/acetoin dehydrogenase complex, dehydrogenase (E1) component n=1 Tax=Desulfuromonas soudanensis TaxID=1603606 RepID=A0A0M3QGD4_9BACT|nr:alpha-ketoacid dehydrogenase subunit beta [Desulfuromonas soudanensis]ALC17623.1 pyruvate/2-oxoglutarate/acetoin dehydrogenase complex, dehydrogenase (E1) component [Desulfuromonas soudanensis]